MAQFRERNAGVKALLRSAAVLFTVLFVSCGLRPGEPIPGANRLASDAELRVRAEALAQSEFSRLAAEALVYRGQTELHETVLPVVGSKVGVYIKMYREFTGYEVVDIARSNSILYPVEMEIRFDFDVLATKVRGIREPDAQKDATADYRFRMFWQDSVTRRYRCDSEGNPVDTFPELHRLKFYRDVSTMNVPGPMDQGRVPF